jgi:hypothetical protein
MKYWRLHDSTRDIEDGVYGTSMGSTEKRRECGVTRGLKIVFKGKEWFRRSRNGEFIGSVEREPPYPG